jgi:hypothetical protein
MLPLLGISCAGEGPVAAEALYDLSCPPPPATCTQPQSTCLGNGGNREILGVNGEAVCDDQSTILAICEAIPRSNGGFVLTLIASVLGQDEDGVPSVDFGFELRGAVVGADDSMSGCEVTIVEDGLAYGSNLGTCGREPPSMDQPCQISNVILGDADGADISFELKCDTLLSSTGHAFDVGGGTDGRATIRFARCTGF